MSPFSTTIKINGLNMIEKRKSGRENACCFFFFYYSPELTDAFDLLFRSRLAVVVLGKYSHYSKQAKKNIEKRRTSFRQAGSNS